MRQQSAEAGDDVGTMPNLMQEDQQAMDLRTLEFMEVGVHGSSDCTNLQYAVNSRGSIGDQVWFLLAISISDGDLLIRCLHDFNC